MACAIVAPEFVSTFQGAVPTFSFADNNPNVLGFEASFTQVRDGGPCSYDTYAKFTPIFAAGPLKYDCSLDIESTNDKTTSILCPGIVNSLIPDATYTLSYKDVESRIQKDGISPIPTTIVIGPSPVAVTATTTSTSLGYVFTTTYASTYLATSTTTAYTKTVTTTRTAVVTESKETTSTYYSSYCPPVSSSLSSKSTSSSKYSSSSQQPVPSSTGKPSSTTTAGFSKPSSTYSSYYSTPLYLPSPSYSPPYTSSYTTVYTPTTLSPYTSTYTPPYTPVFSLSKTSVYQYSTSAPEPTAISCPKDDGKVIITNNRGFRVECGVDRVDHDIGPVNAESFDDCVSQCAYNPNCQDVSYRNGASCYLKSAVGDFASNPDVWGATLVGWWVEASTAPTTTPAKTTPIFSPTFAPTRSPTFSPSSSPAPAKSGPSCPDSDGQLYSTGGKTFKIECGIDHSGGDIKSVYNVNLAGCLDTCSATDGCINVALSGTACYLKGSNTPGEKNAGVEGAVEIGYYDRTKTFSNTFPTITSSRTGPAKSGASSIQCPAKNNTIVVTSCGSTYKIECSFDRSDSDLVVKQAYTLNECIEQCDAYNGCADVSYISGNPGNCYLKSSQNAPNYNENVWGAAKKTDCKKVMLHRKRAARPESRVARSEPRLQQRHRKSYGGPDYTWGPPPRTTITKPAFALTYSTFTRTSTLASSGTTAVTYTNNNPSVSVVYVTSTTTGYAVVGVTATTCPSKPTPY
ncbi:hypothetical protein BS50DRAFT_626006 [Corynespora cassiicola Philippines]|uniref:Apple domain-containing protein n=1 Tax=Corynespora cassiicola Philippines TaxID=1448308 RepID=A0A2T2N6K9_CORCC|nr:hypothetical protein BS50DRAFT_626006 [Corynespora cassiicola Philippines]